MTDRLAELKKSAAAKLRTDPSASLTANDIEQGGSSSSSSSSSSGGGGGGGGTLVTFFADVEKTKTYINQIKEATMEVAEITQQSVLATSSERETELGAALAPILQNTQKNIGFAKKILKLLREETDVLKANPQSKASDIRIRENLVNTLNRKFVDVIKDYQTAQTKYKNELLKKAKRQVQIVKPDATPEEVDAVVQSGNGPDKLIQESILKV